MGDLLRDVVLAIRRFRAAPAFSAFSVVTLAVGIGVTTAIYSIISGSVLRPPQIRDIERVVNIYHANPLYAPGLNSMALSQPDFHDLVAGQTSFQEMTRWRRVRLAVTGAGVSDVMFAEAVDGHYFVMLGAHALLGRTLQPADDRPGAAPLVVISEGFWRRRLEADASVIGRVMTINGRQAEVVGVIALPFQGVDMPNVAPTNFWIPAAAFDALDTDGGAGRSLDREARSWLAKGRLRPGVTVEQAAAEVAAIGRRLDVAHPIGGEDSRPQRFNPRFQRQWHVVRADGLYVHETLHRLAVPAVATVAVLVALVLLVTCSNLANLLLARGAARRHELAIRYALGGSRWRIVREQLVENVLVASVAGVGALFIARWAGVRLAESSTRLGPGVSLQLTPAMDATVIIAATASTAIAFVVFGVLPALLLTRRNPNAVVAADSTAQASPRWRGRRSLIASQVAVSVALTTVALFSARQVADSLRHDTGIDLEHVAAAAFDFRLARYDEPTGREAARRILETVRQAPGAERVALASGLPVGLSPPNATVTPVMSVQPAGQRAALLAVTSGIFEVFGITVVRGRVLDDRDGVNNQQVAVVSALAAQLLFGAADAVGRDVFVRRQPIAGQEPPALVRRVIVGIVSDTDTRIPGQRREGMIFVPFEQHYESRMAVVVRSANAADMAAALPEIVRRADGATAVTDVGTGVQLSGAAKMPLQVTAGLTGMLGTLALLLAMTGLYGVLSYIVTSRRRELGVRRALGADSGHILRLVVFDGLHPVISGLVVGLTAAAVLRISLNSFLRELPPIDPVLVGVVPLLFVAAGVVACYLPARRASRVAPAVVLRDL